MKYTPNYNLKKPEGTDTVNIDDLNNNASILDTEINSINEQIDTLTIQDNSFREQINNLGEEVNELFQSVSDGKTLVAGAITDKGVNTSPTDTFQTMADNIEDIEIDPSIGTTNAVAADVLSPKKVVSQGNILTGTMPNRGGVNQNLTSEGQEYTIPSGYHNGLGKVKAVITGLVASVIKAGTTVGGVFGTFTSDATATAVQILEGVTVYVNGNKITGTAPAKSAQTYIPGTTNQAIAGGQMLTGIQTIQGSANLIAANIKEGVNIFGKVGTLKPVPNVVSSDVVFRHYSTRGTIEYSTTSIGGASTIGETFIVNGLFFLLDFYKYASVNVLCSEPVLMSLGGQYTPPNFIARTSYTYTQPNMSDVCLYIVNPKRLNISVTLVDKDSGGVYAYPFIK